MTKVMENFIQKMTITESVFELLELAYRVLEKEIDNQSSFIAQYMTQSPENSSNPNRGKLSIFHQEIELLFADYSSIKYNQQKEKVKKKIENIRLLKYGSLVQNDLSVVFQLLLAINSAADNWDKFRIRKNWGALNGCSGSYVVYFWNEQPYIDEIKEYIGREQTQDSGFQEFIYNFKFIDRRTWIVKGKTPEVTALEFNNIQGSRLKIALVYPWKNNSFQFVPYKGTLLKIDYIENEQNIIKDNIILQMKNAVNNGANIIVLPEFIVSSQILSCICKQLYIWKRDKTFNSSDLIAVFAGSTTNYSKGNNVMNILDSWGTTIGQYYKFSPYRKKRNNREYEVCEFLKNPGKECSIIFIQGVGAFLPAICRDVIDGIYTSNLVRFFMPLFVIVSAWSPSVKSFKKHFEEYATKYYTSSVLCDSCDAISNENKEATVGMVSSVEKPETVAEAKIEFCKRDSCIKKCKKGCYFLITYDFSKEALLEGKNLEIEKKNCVE